MAEQKDCQKRDSKNDSGGFSSLNVITIKSPCKMDWGLMTGNERVRFCDHCSKNVYNISELTENEALEMINNTEGELCLRIHRRPDGTVSTSDCPPLRERFEISNGRRYLQFSMATLLAFLTASAGLCASAPWIGGKMKPIVDRLFPPAPVATSTPQLVGKISMGGCPGPPPTVQKLRNNKKEKGDSN